MPYIDPAARQHLSKGNAPANAGELNYLLTLICNRYRVSSGNRYQVFNDIIGALEGAKLEMYRRLVAPYEDTKITENGDVYT